LLADNPDGKLWPGACTMVHFHIPSDPNVLRIPATALIFGQHGMQVAKVDAENKVVLRKVQLGRNLGNYVEVSSGVSVSDRLIDSPQETIAPGDTVRISSAQDQSAAGRPIGRDREPATRRSMASRVSWQSTGTWGGVRDFRERKFEICAPAPKVSTRLEYLVVTRSNKAVAHYGARMIGLAAATLAATMGNASAHSRADQIYDANATPKPPLAPSRWDRAHFHRSGTRGRQGVGASPLHPEGPGNVTR